MVLGSGCHFFNSVWVVERCALTGAAGRLQSVQGGVRFFRLISPACPAWLGFLPSVLTLVMAIAGHLLLPTHLKGAVVLDIFGGASFPELGNYTFFVVVIPTSPFDGSALAFMSANCIMSSYSFCNQILMSMY